MDRENCRHLLASLSEYVDGVLEDDLCTEIERHASGCENCRIVIDTLRRTISLYQTTAAQVKLPEDARQRLFHRLELDDFIEGS